MSRNKVNTNHVSTQSSVTNTIIKDSKKVFENECMIDYEEYKEDCDWTPNSEIRLYQAVAKFMDCDERTASKKVNYSLKKKKAEGDQNFVTFEKFQFPGQGQNETPVCTWNEFKQLIPLLPGKKAKQYGAYAAETQNRVQCGDPDAIAQAMRNFENTTVQDRAVQLNELPRSAEAMNVEEKKLEYDEQQGPNKRQKLDDENKQPDRPITDLVTFGMHALQNTVDPLKMSIFEKLLEFKQLESSVKLKELELETEKEKTKQVEEETKQTEQKTKQITEEQKTKQVAEEQKTKQITITSQEKTKQETSQTEATKTVELAKIAKDKEIELQKLKIPKSRSESHLTKDAKKLIWESKFGQKFEGKCEKCKVKRVAAFSAKFVAKEQLTVVKELIAPSNITISCSDCARGDSACLNKVTQNKQRTRVWLATMGPHYTQKCFCCRAKNLNFFDAWEQGHNRAHSAGGATILSNLKPICGMCNSNMGNANMKDFMEANGHDDTEHVGDLPFSDKNVDKLYNYYFNRIKTKPKIRGKTNARQNNIDICFTQNITQA